MDVSKKIARRLFLSRAPLAATVATAALTLPVAASVGALDSELIALGRAFDCLVAEEDAATPADQEDGGWTAWDAAYARTGAIVKEIEALPVGSLDGLRVKARAIIWCHGGQFEGFGDDETTDVRLARQIIQALSA